jgi:hypothetical protein
MVRLRRIAKTTTDGRVPNHDDRVPNNDDRGGHHHHHQQTSPLLLVFKHLRASAEDNGRSGSSINGSRCVGAADHQGSVLHQKNDRRVSISLFFLLPLLDAFTTSHLLDCCGIVLL